MSDFDLQGLAQVSVSTDLPAHKRIVNDAITEIATLRQQLTAAQADNEALRARVAELEVGLHGIANCAFGYSGARQTAEEAAGWMNGEAMRLLGDPQPDAFVLCKQAEAVEEAKYQHALTARIPDGTAGCHFQEGFDTAAEQYDDSLDRYAQRLRQQADEAEKGVGS